MSYRRFPPLDLELIKNEAAKIRAAKQVMTRRRIAVGLGSSHPNDSIEQRLYSAILQHPDLVPELTEALSRSNGRASHAFNYLTRSEETA